MTEVWILNRVQKTCTYCRYDHRHWLLSCLYWQWTGTWKRWLQVSNSETISVSSTDRRFENRDKASAQLPASLTLLTSMSLSGLHDRDRIWS